MLENQKDSKSIQVQKYLKGVDYPASKQDLINAARENDATDNVLNILDNLAEQEFQTSTHVSEAIGDSRKE